MPIGANPKTSSFRHLGPIKKADAEVREERILLLLGFHNGARCGMSAHRPARRQGNRPPREKRAVAHNIVGIEVSRHEIVVLGLEGRPCPQRRTLYESRLAIEIRSLEQGVVIRCAHEALVGTCSGRLSFSWLSRLRKFNTGRLSPQRHQTHGEQYCQSSAQRHPAQGSGARLNAAHMGLSGPSGTQQPKRGPSFPSFHNILLVD